MNDILILYIKHILEVIENEIKKQRKKIGKKWVFSSKTDRDHLKKLEDLLFEKLNVFGKMIEEEVEFNESITKIVDAKNKGS